MRINPKLKYLAEVAAGYTDRTLSKFIEDAIRQALNPESMSRHEPAPGSKAAASKAAPQLWGDGLWDEDEATRMFMLAVSHPTLLSGPQKNLWTLLSGSILANKKTLNLKTFREYYNSPSINTSHLTEGNE
jgi:hypothetical protein